MLEERNLLDLMDFDHFFLNTKGFFFKDFEGLIRYN